MSPIWDDLKRKFGRRTGAEGSGGDASRQDDVTQSEEAARPDPGQVRMVYCAKFRRELPGLDRPPFPGELGQRIFENVSQHAFEMWRQQQTLIINHYGLNLADPEAKQYLMQEMEAFFFADHEHVPEGWIPEDQSSDLGPWGKGSPPGPQGKGGSPFGPQSKGGGPPGPARKA